jgi:hypothetical protein
MVSGIHDEDVIDDQPQIDLLLPDEPGDDRCGLLPVSALGQPVRVRFLPWENTMPTPAWPEAVTLFRGTSQVIASKTWIAPIEPDDYWIDIDVSGWPDGQEHIYYRVQIFNGAISRSQASPLFIDTKAPVLAGQLELSPELAAEGLTAHYLETHDDTLIVGVPTYSDSRPGDTVELFWDAHLYDDTLIEQWRLTQNDLAATLSLPLAGDLIREQGDGARYLHFKVVDRAGNRSADSRMVQLQVAAAPSPRSLPPPQVTQASGNGSAQVLAPASAAQGVTVTITGADIYQEETLWLQWAVPGSVGAWTSATIAGTQRWTFNVPATVIGAHLGKQLEVRYCLNTLRGEETSEPCLLTVQSAAKDFFSILRCTQANNDQLRLASVPATGADLQLPAWRLISTDQRVRIDLLGTTNAGYLQTLPILQPKAVSAIELTTGLSNIKVPKAFLSSLRLNTQLTFNVFVSFDQGATWPTDPNFPQLRLTLKA